MNTQDFTLIVIIAFFVSLVVCMLIMHSRFVPKSKYKELEKKYQDVVLENQALEARLRKVASGTDGFTSNDMHKISIGVIMGKALSVITGLFGF